MFTEKELSSLQDRVYAEMIPTLDDVRRKFENEYKKDDDPEEHMNHFTDMLETLKKVYALPDVEKAVDEQVNVTKDWINEIGSEYRQDKPHRELSEIRSSPEIVSARGIFDDVDE